MSVISSNDPLLTLGATVISAFYNAHRQTHTTSFNYFVWKEMSFYQKYESFLFGSLLYEEI
jgi:hypothetical protein